MTVDVWVGWVSSRERLERYLEEFYDDEDDTTPLSEFAGDMNEKFYDHDFLESSFHEEVAEDVGALLQLHSLPDSVIRLAVESFERAPEPLNCVVLMQNEDDFFQIERPVSVQKEDVRLWFLGRFEWAT